MKIKPVKQRDASACGPTCVEMTLKYFKVPHAVAQITKVSDYKKEGGLYNRQLVRVLQLFGLKTKVYKNTDWETLRKINDNRSVIIVSWMLDGYVGHLSVVEKVDNKYIYLAEPTTGTIKKMAKLKFLRLWLDYEAKSDVPMYPESKADIQLRWLVKATK